jgi:hypothetical protein
MEWSNGIISFQAITSLAGLCHQQSTKNSRTFSSHNSRPYSCTTPPDFLLLAVWELAFVTINDRGRLITLASEITTYLL